MKNPAITSGWTGTHRGSPGRDGYATNHTRNKPPRLRLFCFLSDLGREADAGRADDAPLLQPRLHLVRAQPRAGLCHVGNIREDYHLIRIVGAPKHFTVRDSRRLATLLVFVIPCTPCVEVLDLEVDGQV